METSIFVKLGHNTVAELVFTPNISDDEIQKKYEKMFKDRNEVPDGDHADPKVREELGEKTFTYTNRLFHLEFYCNKSEFEVKTLTGDDFRKLMDEIDKFEEKTFKMKYKDWI